MGLGIDKDLLPGLDELPQSGEGSRSDFESNPPGAFGRVEFDDFGVEDFPGPQDP